MILLSVSSVAGYPDLATYLAGYAITGEALEDQREDGIVASLVQARGGMAPGMAAVLMHRNAQMPWEG